MNVGHWSEVVTPTHLCKVLIAPGLGFLPISASFRPYLHQVPDTITLKTITGCTWDITIRDINGRACLDQGWPAFAIAHNLKIGYFLTLTAKVYKVVIFNYSCAEVVERCPDQPEAFQRYVDGE